MKDKPMKGRERINNTALRSNIKNLDPKTQALLNLVVPSDKEDNPNNYAFDREKLSKITQVVINNINDVKVLRSMTPYIDKAELIYKTLLLHPNGIQDEVLTYDTNETTFKITNLYEKLTSEVEKYFKYDYKIEEKLPDMISEVMFGSGAYIFLNLSKNVLDYIINGNQVGGTESFSKEFTIKEYKHLLKDDLEFKNNGEIVVKNKGLISDVKDNVGGLEALFSKDKGNYGEEVRVGLNDDLKNAFNITLTDNPICLSLGNLKKSMIDRRKKSIIGSEDLFTIVSEEIGGNVKDMPDRKSKPRAANTKVGHLEEKEMSNLIKGIYPQREYQDIPMMRIDNNYHLKGDNTGAGYTTILPPDCVIRIHSVGDVKTTIAVIALVDEDGNFLRKSTDSNFYNYKSPEDSEKEDMKSKSASSMFIFNMGRINNREPCNITLEEFRQLGLNLIEESFIDAIANNTTQNISLKVEQTLLDIFLQRSLKQQKTRALFIPGEAITYIANEYNGIGLGVSLATKAKPYIQRLALLNLTNDLAQIQGAQPTWLMTVKIDKNNPNPYQAIEAAKETYFGNNRTVHDILTTGDFNMVDMIENLKGQILNVKVDSDENPFIPDINVDIEQQEKVGFKAIEDSVIERNENAIANIMLLDKTWLDSSESTNNFKSEALAEEELTRNNVIMFQKTFCNGINDFQRKHIMINRTLLNKLIKIITDSKESELKPNSSEGKAELSKMNAKEKVFTLLNDFIQNLVVSLPLPSSNESIDKIKSKIETAKGLVEVWMEASSIKSYMTMLTELKSKIDGLEDKEKEALEQQIESSIKDYLTRMAFRQTNLPLPWDDAVNEKSDTGIHSILNEVLANHNNSINFLSEFINKVNKETIKPLASLFSNYGEYLEKFDEELGKVSEEVKDEEEGESGYDEGEESSDDGDESGNDDEPEDGEESTDEDENSESEDSEESNDEPEEGDDKDEKDDDADDEEPKEEKENKDKTPSNKEVDNAFDELDNL